MEWTTGESRDISRSTQSIRESRLRAAIYKDALTGTVNPDRAITHGVSHLVGHITPGTLADLVLWKTENFGSKPELVLKSGVIVWGQMGDWTRPSGSHTTGYRLGKLRPTPQNARTPIGSLMFSLPGSEQGAVVEDAGRALDLVRAGKSLSCGTLADSHF